MGNGHLLIVVPARGGSKGLPRKNIRNLGGIPLISWTAKAVRLANLNNTSVFLSTDDTEIAEIGAAVGLEVPFIRPAEIATDTASAESVALHALNWLYDERGIRAEYVMLLQPTSPFRPPEKIKEAISYVVDPNINGVIGVKPIFRTTATLFQLDANMLVSSLGDQTQHRSRRQDTQPLYTPNGAMYLIRSQVLEDQGSFFPNGLKGLEFDSVASLDIDCQTDFQIAAAIAAAGLSWRT